MSWPRPGKSAAGRSQPTAAALTFPTSLTGNDGIIAALVGVAATFTRQPWIRAATGAIHVPGYALVVTVNTDTYLTAAYTPEGV